MNFLKNFFDDESKIVGLCGFEKRGLGFCQKDIINNVLFTNVSFEKHFETNFTKNMFLSV